MCYIYKACLPTENGGQVFIFAYFQAGHEKPFCFSGQIRFVFCLYIGKTDQNGLDTQCVYAKNYGRQNGKY